LKYNFATRGLWKSVEYSRNFINTGLETIDIQSELETKDYSRCTTAIRRPKNAPHATNPEHAHAMISWRQCKDENANHADDRGTRQQVAKGGSGGQGKDTTIDYQG
jgi:hypothetical protein